MIGLVSDNCWAGYVYDFLQMSYTTPFVNMYIHTPDYIKLLENFDYYINQELKMGEICNSKYFDIDLCKSTLIGFLDDVEIRFPHYDLNSVAVENWNKRKSRIPKDKNDILFKLENIYGHKFIHYSNFDELINRFYKLPFKNKISITRKKYEYPNNFQMLIEHELRCDLEGKEIEKYFDIKYWVYCREFRQLITH
jgi:uncharacterized protein (DUF1919 family)